MVTPLHTARRDLLVVRGFVAGTGDDDRPGARRRAADRSGARARAVAERADAATTSSPASATARSARSTRRAAGPAQRRRHLRRVPGPRPRAARHGGPAGAARAGPVEPDRRGRRAAAVLLHPAVVRVRAAGLRGAVPGQPRRDPRRAPRLPRHRREPDPVRRACRAFPPWSGHRAPTGGAGRGAPPRCRSRATARSVPNGVGARRGSPTATADRWAWTRRSPAIWHRASDPPAGRRPYRRDLPSRTPRGAPPTCRTAPSTRCTARTTTTSGSWHSPTARSRRRSPAAAPGAGDTADAPPVLDIDRAAVDEDDE